MAQLQQNKQHYALNMRQAVIDKQKLEYLSMLRGPLRTHPAQFGGRLNKKTNDHLFERVARC
jgi:hypothetical protein